MLPRLFARIAMIAALGSCAAACSTFNPFTSDTARAAPQSPELWSGAYGGEPSGDDRRDTGDHYEDKGRYTDDSRDHVDIAEATPPKSYRSNGNVQSSALPPPTKGAALPPPVDPHADGDVDPPAAAHSDDSGGTIRTLNTSHTADAEPPAPPKPIAEAKTVTHKVKNGESLSDVAEQYDVREVEIIALNNLRPPYTLRDGQTLKIPTKGQAAARPVKGDVVVAGDRVPTPLPKPNMGGRRVAAGASASEPTAKPAAIAAADEAPASSGGRFEWPVTGKVIASYGAAGDGLYNEGINIAVPEGTPVHAAAAGTVRYAGNELQGYGNLVLIEHPDGYVTAYAHNSKLIVKRGDHVDRGTVIARSGQTGNVKSPQVHFEVRKGKQSIDPQKYLVATN